MKLQCLVIILAALSAACSEPTAADGAPSPAPATVDAQTPDEVREAPAEPRAEAAPIESPETVKKGSGMKKEITTLGAGCFWCTEAVYQQIEGVVSVESGYMGGTVENPTYEQVCGKNTGHAEVVQVTFDPDRVDFATILGWFWKLHDPTSKSRQGADEGPQYRSVIFYHSEEQRRIAEQEKEKAQAHFSRPIVTEISPAGPFWKAEGYHQDFYRQNKQYPYCRGVIVPKLEKLGLKR